ncbi:MAG: TetR/AcrR family transcriptional regulator [Nannocystaceae bacterium]
MSKLDRQRWIDAAFDALCEAGETQVRINSLCATLGVTKGSFYWHFDSHDALLQALLERWELSGTDAIIDELDESGKSAAQRLRMLVRAAFAESSRGDRIESAIRAWASHDQRAAASVARVDERRVAYVRELLRAAGVGAAAAGHRSALLYRTLIGDSTWRSHGGSGLSPAALQQLVRMLLHDV